MLSKYVFFQKSFIFFTSIAIGGCSFFLPKHPNSNYRVDETTKLEMLDCNAMLPYSSRYKAAFPKNNLGDPTKGCGSAGTSQSMGVTAGLIAVNLAFSEIQKRIKEESKLYTAQYTASDFTTNFAINSKDGRNLNIYGFKLTRKVNDKPASEFIFGFAPAGSKSPFILVAPISIQVQKAKAKVLNDDLWTWLPPFIVSKFIAEDSHSIDIDVELKLKEEWVRNEASDVQSRENTMTYSFPGYDLDSTLQLCANKTSDGCAGLLPAFQRRVIVAPPDAVNHLVSIDLLVTEKDSWNTPEKLTWLGKQLDSAKEKVDETLKPKDK